MVLGGNWRGFQFASRHSGSTLFKRGKGSDTGGGLDR